MNMERRIGKFFTRSRHTKRTLLQTGVLCLTRILHQAALRVHKFCWILLDRFRVRVCGLTRRLLCAAQETDLNRVGLGPGEHIGDHHHFRLGAHLLPFAQDAQCALQ